MSRSVFWLKTILISLVAVAVWLLPIAVMAEDIATPVDKSAYTFFNPVPDDLMRSFSTDRPSKSDSPYTVDAGHFQYEADLINWTYDRYNAAPMTVSNVMVADPTLKLGLTQNADFELALAPINFNSSHDRSTGQSNIASGFGDVYTRMKYNLLGNEGGDYALAVVPYVKMPTAAHDVGNNHWEGGGYVPFSMALPDEWTLAITSEVDILENASSSGMHGNFQNLINFSHAVFADDITGAAEFWSDVDNDRNAPNQYTLDFSLAWLVNNNLQLDGGLNIGLDKAASDVQPYLGISQRF